MNLQQADENNTVFEMATTFVNETSEHIFLTGKAGTGKTTFLRHIRQLTHKYAVVAAPTGVAAINAGGVTLHSLFQLPFEPYVPGYSNQKNRFRFSKAKLDMLRQLELLIIDEVSMLRADTLDSIDRTLQSLRRNTQPFGGLQVLYIGDMFQLPPVVKDEEWELLQPHYESVFFFHAQVFRQTQPVYLELKKVYRQSEQVFVDLLNNVRNNCLTDADMRLLNARYRPDFIAPSEDKYITLTTHNYKADRLNRQELDKIAGREYVFAGKIEGEFPEYALPTDMQLCLKNGAQVMFIKNDPDGRYFNGKIATVSSIGNDRIEVRMPEKEIVQVPRETWKNIRYSLNKESGEMEEEDIGAYTQYPLRLAWAVTIHKSQGLTFDKAIIDIGASFAAGQAYVALSRCTSLEGIILRTPVSHHCIMTDAHAVDFSKTEKEDTVLQQILAEGKRKFWKERLLMYFEWKPMFTFLWELEKLLEDKTSEEFEPARKLHAEFKQVVREMNEVAGKFRQQLLVLAEQEKSTGDLQPLRDRCRKAVQYFYEQTGARILTPLQNFITGFKLSKRAKTFHKNILELESDVKLFLENMKRVRYNNIPLAEDLETALPERSDIFGSAENTQTEGSKPSSGRRSRNRKAEQTPKVDTRRLTLALFSAGLSMEEIAAQRNLAVSTIESHLAEFAGKEVSIDKFFGPDELDEIGTALKPFLDHDNPPFKIIYGQTGGKYTYGKLRMALGYLKRSSNKEEPDTESA